MIFNYIKTAWRNTLGSISYSAINIMGLAAGLSSFIVILLYLNYELSYDKWSPELNKVYRISLRENEDFLKTTPAPLADFLARKYPNAEAATSLQSAGDFELLLSVGDHRLYSKNVVTVDSSFLKVFPYHLLKGDPATALNTPKAAILTEDLSRKLFGNTEPIGKTVKILNLVNCVVTGVMRQPDQPGHMPVEMLMRDPWGKQNNHWQNYSFQTYIKLRHPETDGTIETAINRLYYYERTKKPNTSFEAYEKEGAKTALFVDVVPRIHNFPKHASSNFSTVSILLVLAVLLLLAGAINFSNLAIAKSISRAKEVGVRKVLGSGRRQLVFQFMTETALQCLSSLIIAVVLLNLALPYINQTFNITLNFWQQNDALSIVIQIAVCLLVVITLSGLYPSVYLSRFNAVKVLKGNYSSGKRGAVFRNSLIVVQFMVSVFFITGILVIKNQMSFMQNSDKGFSGRQVMRIQAMQATSEGHFNDNRNILLTIRGVSYVSKTTKVPGDNMFADTTTYGFKCEGKTYRMSSVKISTDYFKTMNIGLKQGRYFNDEVADQNTRTVVINETAARKLHFADPIGKNITFPYCDSIPLRIVGVVKDFNVQGFESEIQPVIFTIGQKACMFQSGGAILVKLNSSHMRQSIAAISDAWKKIEPGFPMRYSFVDENFKQLFVSYSRLQQIITFFGVIAILISVMGLFALTAFFTRQRTKEIGVRKVLGAGVVQLATLLSKEFIYLVLLSVVIITPIAWWLMQKWLQTFVYRIDISWWIFIAAGAAAIMIAIVTVSFQSIRVALANPVNSLRSE
jgi:putative ABC transport system permease protein